MKTATSIIIFLITLAGISFAFQVSGDDDEHEAGTSWLQRKPGVIPVKNTLYKQECASCHMAYSPGLLPASSWKKLMSSLENHYGENAELDAATQMKLTDYLVQNAADKSDYRRSRKIMRSLTGKTTPDRITDIPYFKRKHRELNNAMVRNNPEVGSFSNCAACHRKVEQGSFRESEILIPNYGRWDD